MMKLGAELELKNTDTRASTLKSREIFLGLILKLKPEAVEDLMRLFNIESLPDGARDDMDSMVFFTKFFFMHTKESRLYSIDLSEIGLQRFARDTPVLAYFEFIFKNQRKFDRSLKKSEKEWKKYTQYPSQDLITLSAIEDLIPDWNTLRSKYKTEKIYIELYRWAEKWNLTDDWCLDFALECLRNFKINLIDKFRFPENYLKDSGSGSIWYLNQYRFEGKAWHESFFELRIRNIQAPIKVPECPRFTYEWEIGTEGEAVQCIIAFQEYYNPLMMLARKFRKKAKEYFWMQLTEYLSRQRLTFVDDHGSLVNELDKFDKALENHIRQIDAMMKPFAQKTPEKKDGDKHFRWLIEYQIPLTKGFEQIGKESRTTGDNVGKAIKATSKLLGLKLRRSVRAGRPPGIREAKPRHRAEK